LALVPYNDMTIAPPVKKPYITSFGPKTPFPCPSKQSHAEACPFKGPDASTKTRYDHLPMDIEDGDPLESPLELGSVRIQRAIVGPLAVPASLGPKSRELAELSEQLGGMILQFDRITIRPPRLSEMAVKPTVQYVEEEFVLDPPPLWTPSWTPSMATPMGRSPTLSTAPSTFAYRKPKSSRPKYGRSQRYRAVFALVLEWEEHDLDEYEDAETGSIELGLDEEAEWFQDVLESRGYQVCKFPIPMQKSIISTRRTLKRFFEYANSETLLIVYYHGHGEMSATGELRLARCVNKSHLPHRRVEVWSLTTDNIFGNVATAKPPPVKSPGAISATSSAALPPTCF
jgi:hypothetical protein